MAGRDDGLGAVLGDEDVDPDRRQRPMETRRSDYAETGRLQVMGGPPGQLPLVVGGEPAVAEVGLTEENFVCNAVPGRPACQFYGALLLPADGVARGFGEMREIRRFCLKMATASEMFELDGEVYACTLRRPPCPSSAAKIEAFEQRQRDIAQESAETIGQEDI